MEDMRKGRPSRRLLDLASRKRQPVPLESQPLEVLLYALFGNLQAARSIGQALQGDIRNIHGWDIRDLESLPGVGRGVIGKLAALVEIVRRLHQKKAT
ncbi:hypothetical protein [Meiothermus ruber]|uniref:hypothetical protein n=1 Tax=Meiothermus ruber TaxID=277 RepID=UPI00034A2A21|nr:hypothetical protein [Meiothermus ruber]GAO73791.1 putative uncharacterized protein [Meiothermus ruber H328]GAO75122.1 putative uncharacterized protein [Meiothermus ruber H328]